MFHAVTSSKDGLKSQHLGLHKALCALMGWKSADAPNSGWVREMLSDTETVGLKEDLIIWPPVVIIHNSSMMNSDPDQRVVVSAEELESKLKGRFPFFFAVDDTILASFFGGRGVMIHVF